MGVDDKSGDGRCAGTSWDSFLFLFLFPRPLPVFLCCLHCHVSSSPSDRRADPSGCERDGALIRGWLSDARLGFVSTPLILVLVLLARLLLIWAILHVLSALLLDI